MRPARAAGSVERLALQRGIQGAAPLRGTTKILSTHGSAPCGELYIQLNGCDIQSIYVFFEKLVVVRDFLVEMRVHI